MSYKIRVSPIAQSHIEDAFYYYKNKTSLTVATNFKNSLAQVYKILSINPFFEIRAQNYRAIPLKKFPYIIFFEVDQAHKEVKVIAIFNTNRNTVKYPR